MKKLIFFSLGVVCALSSCNAQPSSKNTTKSSNSRITPLKIGDTVPDMFFDQVMNYSDKTARLSDFLENKKLLILDFWSTSCSACIGLFPHMQSLADRFKDNLQVILVNGKTQVWHDNEAKINGLLERMKTSGDGNITLPVVLNCKKLDTLFPWKTIPHEVWINGKGEVIAITGSREVNSQNIRDVIAGKDIRLPVKKDVFFDIEHHSLSSLMYGNNQLVNYRPINSSILIRGNIDGLGGGSGVRTADSIGRRFYIGWYITNLPLLGLYRKAFPNIVKYPSNRIIIKGDSQKLFRSLENVPAKVYHNNVYSYDLTTPPIGAATLKEHLQADLETTFNTHVYHTQKVMKCFILTTPDHPISCLTKGGAKKYKMVGGQKYVRNFPLKDLVQDFNLKYFKHPLVNETHLGGSVDLNFPDVLTEKSIMQTLKQAGFKIKAEKRKMDVAVISFTNN